MADARRQLRSGTVELGGMGLLAAALTACSSDPDKRVDRDSYTAAKGYKVVADKSCTSTKSSAHGVWYYGGSMKGSQPGATPVIREEACCYQELVPLSAFDGNHVVLGAWVVEDESAGLGIRGSSGLITDEYARFLPHVILQTSDYTPNTARN
jgi:hypothetical protein